MIVLNNKLNGVHEPESHWTLRPSLVYISRMNEEQSSVLENCNLASQCKEASKGQVAQSSPAGHRGQKD